MLRALLTAVTVVLAALAATAGLAFLLLSPSAADLLEMVGGLLAATFVVSLVAAMGLRLRKGRAYGGLRVALMAPALIGILLILASVFITAQLMFFSSHDLLLLSCLLVFALIVSVALAWAAAGLLGARVRELDLAAAAMGAGRRERRLLTGGDDELGRLATTFNSMADRLQSAEAKRVEMEGARRDLVAAISHDLRTPLSSMRAMVEAIDDGVVEGEEARDYLHGVLDEIRLLGLLIDDLFELSRIDSGQLTLHYEETDIASLIGETVNGMRQQARERGVSLQSAVGAGVGVVLADGGKLQRSLYNLVHNALRHTPSDGTVMVEAKETGSEILISVTDSGEGISGADLPHVFDRFYRGDASRHSDGSGLGLAIVRGIVEAHRGRVWAESEPGAGARFYLALPVAASATAAAPNYN